MDKLIGSVIRIDGRDYLIHEKLSETLKDELREEWVVYEATFPNDNAIHKSTRRYALKVRYGRRPRGISETRLAVTEALAKRFYNGECRALSISSKSGYTPVFYGSEELSSNQNPFFRHGHVWAIAMGLADGTSLYELSELSYSDKVIIQEEMIKALE
ncbi:hypothetical protein BO82DRAFT_354797 [Aspergillus uvarum CBS 121591]|uniref:Uncharacterized protein n=1 Tax=Aspergillus uvarum CBS 121591 TaxID=1448315 RepID=A0A319CAS5_9EURO|nr:hypothetical protein BO82DRAFT_354797 [Aspergillus uvarum CBS 121591]PYH81370.1 hypothetical protein BO82DRAFT_354797 [Aspergillus uvarum CBS 121591]